MESGQENERLEVSVGEAIGMEEGSNREKKVGVLTNIYRIHV